MYPWISRTLDLWLQFCEKKCGLYMDVYGNQKLTVLNECLEPKSAKPKTCEKSKGFLSTKKKFSARFLLNPFKPNIKTVSWYLLSL